MEASRATTRQQALAARRAAAGGGRLRRADQAEGAVAAAPDDDHDDVRGGRPVALARRADCLGGSLSAGGAGAVNHWFDRDIDAQMARTANRPVPAGRIAPAAALWFGIVLAALSFAELSLAVNVLSAVARARRLPRLRLRLHGLAQAPQPAEHRHRRRGGRRAAAGRLDRGDRLARPDRAVPVRDRLLLDAAALLGAVAADEGRVRARGRADDAGRPRRDRDAAPDRPLHRPAVRAHAAAGRVRLLRRDLRHRGGRARHRVHRSSRCASSAAPTAAARCAPTCSRSSTWRCCSAPWWPTPACRLGAAWTASSHAATSAPG